MKRKRDKVLVREDIQRMKRQKLEMSEESEIIQEEENIQSIREETEIIKIYKLKMSIGCIKSCL